MENLSFAMQVAALGIVIVLAVLVVLIGLVKTQNLLLNHYDESKQIKMSKSNKAGKVPKDTDISEQSLEYIGDNLSPEIVAAITVAVYQIVDKPVRIGSIKPIFPQKRKNWKRASIHERFGKGKQLLG